MIPTVPANILTLIVFLWLTFGFHELVMIVPVSWNIVVAINNRLRGRVRTKNSWKIKETPLTNK